MIEAGIVQYINTHLSNPPSTIGGFLGTLPDNQPLPSWSYLVVENKRQTALLSVTGLSYMWLQIDCYGAQDAQGADSITLAYAIDHILNGFRGTLPDVDSTYVDSCISMNTQDFHLDPDARTYRRMIEYDIWYAQK